MLTHDELLEHPNYLLSTYQLQIYRELSNYMETNKLKKKDIAQKLKVSNSYISQVLSGNFNFTLKKLIELGLMMNKVPYLEFVEPFEYWRREADGTREILVKETHYTVDSSMTVCQGFDNFRNSRRLDLQGGCLPKSVSTHSNKIAVG